MGERDDQRYIPNDYAHSSLFTARSYREPRKSLTQKKLFHLHETVSILYTGIELRAIDDELVWLQILNYGKNVALGESFEFSIKDLVRDVGWNKSGSYYDKARECISRVRGGKPGCHQANIKRIFCWRRLVLDLEHSCCVGFTTCS